MSAAQARLAVERAIVELSNIDDALTVTVGAIRSRVATALGELTAARERFEREAAEARATIEEQAADDVASMQADTEEPKDDAREWFDSWLADYAHEIEPLTEAEAWAVYSAAFEAKRKGADHG